jgi:hypothetical protein
VRAGNEAAVAARDRADELFDDARMAALELVYRYRFNVTPGRFFAWFREILSAQVKPGKRSIEHTFRVGP